MKRLSRQLRNNSGFTLIEVIIAVLILSIIASAALLAFVFSMNIVNDNQYEMKALNLANDRVEYIRSLEFAKVGTILGDPVGDIEQSETTVVDNVNYLINTTVNWESESGWELTSSDWDYKSVRVEVIPQIKGKEQKLAQTVQTYVTRSSTQPILPGANIAVRFIRGWKVNPTDVSPVANIKVSLVAGPGAPRQSLTSSQGIVRFMNLAEGTFNVNLVPSSAGMMLSPDVSSDWGDSLTAGYTQAKQFEVEYPCNLNISLKSLEGDAITLNGSETGNIKIDVPYGTDIDKNFEAADLSSTGVLSQSLLGGVWPVGVGYPGAYTINSIAIKNSTYFGAYESNGAAETLWSGTFDAPGTTKNIICYFGVLPKTPSGVGTNWVMSNGDIQTDNTPYTAAKAIFATSDRKNSLIMQNGKASDFNADDLYFENTGTATNYGLVIRDYSSLRLHAAKIIFRGKINIESDDGTKQGKMTLYNVFSNGTNAYQIPGTSIGGSAIPEKMYGKVYFTEPLMVKGVKLVDPGSYYFYDGLVLPDNISDLIPITKDNYVG